MSRRDRRRQQGRTSAAAQHISEPPLGPDDDVVVVALRLALGALTAEGELERQWHVRRELMRIYEGSPGSLMGVAVYFLDNFLYGLEQGNGSREAAIDELSRGISEAMLAAGETK